MPHTNTVLSACVLLLTVFLCNNLLASETSAEQIVVNGGMSPELVNALLAINLDKEQRGQFGAELRKYSAKLQSAVSRITRRSTPDQDSELKRKTRSLTKSMDQAMRKVLREDQWPAYEAYKAEFAKPPQLQPETTGLDGRLNNH